jgi:hypothetical protein
MSITEETPNFPRPSPQGFVVSPSGYKYQGKISPSTGNHSPAYSPDVSWSKRNESNFPRSPDVSLHPYPGGFDGLQQCRNTFAGIDCYRNRHTHIYTGNQHT